MYWNGVPGCASQIAVSANNFPVMIACGGGIVFYESPNVQQCTTSGGLKTCVPQWTATNTTTAAYIADNIDGNFWMTDTAGAQWVAGDTGTGNGGFTGNWGEVSTSLNDVPACMTSIAVAHSENDPLSVVFMNPPSNGVIPRLWGVECHGSPYGTGYGALWSLPIGLYDQEIVASRTWQQQGAAQGNEATQITLFTDEDNTSITQNPWVVGNGFIFYFDGQSYQLQNAAPADVTYATDHYIVAGGSVYYWNGTADGGGTATWTYVIGPTPNFPIKQIAWSPAVPNTPNGTIGPSALWANDEYGNIYYMYDAPPPPR